MDNSSIIIETVDHTGSTNHDLILRADEGAPEGLWLRAKSQGAGRGRNARDWISPQGNIYTSTIIRLKSDKLPATNLAFVAANALHEVIQSYLIGHNAMIKWPNDILIDDAKICGILLERSRDAVIMGTGVNLAHSPQNIDRKATSLLELGARAVEPDQFMERLSQTFAKWLELWRNEGFAPIRNYWSKHAHDNGQKLRHENIVGEFAGIDDDGACLLKLPNGAIHLVNAGDIFMAE